MDTPNDNYKSCAEAENAECKIDSELSCNDSDC